MKMMRFAIDINDLTVIDLICARNDILNSKNIDKLIEYAIQNTQNGGSHEIQIMLINYKNDNIGFSDIKFDL